MKRRILSSSGVLPALRGGVITCASVLLALGCGDAGSPAGSETISGPNGSVPTSRGDNGSRGDTTLPDSPNNIPTSPQTGAAGSGEVPLPTDTRPPVNAEVAPPPISGGTLIIAADGLTAVAADPDRDRVLFVDLQRGQVLSELVLNPGDEPGRLTEDAAGRIHVALRGSGELASIDLAKRTLIERRSVCPAPRGVAYERGSDSLHVACIDGQLLTLPAAGGKAIRERNLGTDIRDVVVTSRGLSVSRFKAAEVLELDSAGDVLQTRGMLETSQVRIDPEKGEAKNQTFAPVLARRAVPFNSDSVLVLHERALNDTIELEDPHASSTSGSEDNGGVIVPPKFPGSAGGSSYGGAGDCSAIVQTALSIVDGSGKVMHSASLSGVVLPVDVAVSHDGRMIAVADAGQRDLNAPQRNQFFPEPAASTGGVGLFNIAQQPMVEQKDLGQNCMFGSIAVEGNQPIAVAFTPDGTLVVQSRQPSRLALFSTGDVRTIELGGEDRLDTGHEIFHRDAGAGIACASCHGEGGDDGHVWNFSTLGPRRTQSINVGLANTEPFHWSGDMADLNMLVSEVFVGRMGGVPQSDTRIGALAAWMFALQAPPPPRANNDEAAMRGKHLFESSAVGCTGCHSGEKLTNNKTVNVGTGEPLQVPSLVGIAYRAPFIHTGCASTLKARFDPECGGGDEHGKTSQLNDAEIDDLVAYLETL